jgi:endosialidase-like protein
MKTLKRSITMLLFIWLCMPLTQAQPAQDKQQEAQAIKTIAQDVLINIQQEQVRITAQKAVAEMHLQVFDQIGQLVYDSGAVTEPELNWVLRQANGETVKTGLYAYTLSVKGAGAETALVRRGHFIVDRFRDRAGQMDRIWITIHDDGEEGTESTAATGEGVMIAGASATNEHKSVEAAAGTAHNGESDSKKKNNPPMAELVSGTTGQIAKFTSATDLGNSVMTEQNGNVGIGTTSPISKFHIVAGTSDILPPRLQSSGTNTFSAGFDFYHGSTGKGYVGVPDGGTGLAAGEMLVYGVGTTSLWAGGQRSVTIAPDGRVGIGAINPYQSTRLYVEGNSSGTALVVSNSHSMALNASTIDGSAVIGSAGPNGYAGEFNGTVRVRGNVMPADYGMFDLGNSDNTRWRYVYAYTVNAYNIIQTSDARLKKGVTNLRYGLSELMKLRPVSFEWKDRSDGQQNLGFIAQETEQIIPEAVTRAANPDTPLGMNYTTLIPVVIKAIQEQQNTLTTLKNENEALQQRNSTLQRQNADLDARLMALEQMMQQLTAIAGSGARDQAPAVSSVSQGAASPQK